MTRKQRQELPARVWFEIMAATAFVIIGWVACFNVHQAGIGVFVFYIAGWFLLRRHDVEAVDWDDEFQRVLAKKAQ